MLLLEEALVRQPQMRFLWTSQRRGGAVSGLAGEQADVRRRVVRMALRRLAINPGKRGRPLFDTLPGPPIGGHLLCTRVRAPVPYGENAQCATAGYG